MDERYTLHAYVCGRDCVVGSQHVGAMTFRQIFADRPVTCRYAVVEIGGKVLVWDMFDTAGMQQRGRMWLTPPPPIRETEDVDSAIVATAMLYDQD
jgi:hypothetical protein